MINSIEFYDTNNNFLFSVFEYDSFLDAEIVIEQSDDESFYYYQIKNIKITDPAQVDLIWNSYYSYKVRIVTNFGAFGGYVDLDNIERVENYLLIKIDFDTVNKFISDTKAILLPIDVRKSYQIKVRYEAGLGNYPVTSFILACVTFLILFKTEIDKIKQDLTNTFGLVVVPVNHPAILTSSAIKIANLASETLLLNLKFVMQLRTIRSILDFITQKYNLLFVSDIVEELRNNNIETNILDFVDKDTCFIFRTRKIILNDIIKIIQKMYNKIVVTYQTFDTSHKTYVRFVDKHDIQYRNRSYIKNYKKENYFLSNILTVSFREEKVNFYSYLDQNFTNQYTKYVKIIENASKSIKIDIEADLAAVKRKKSAEDIIINFLQVFSTLFFAYNLAYILILLNSLSAIATLQIYYITVLTILEGYYALYLTYILSYNSFVDKIVTANVSSEILIANIYNTRKDKNLIKDYKARDRTIFLNDVKRAYSKNYYKLKYKENVFLDDVDVSLIIQNPVGVDKLVYNLYKNVANVEAYNLIEVYPNVKIEEFV